MHTCTCLPVYTHTLVYLCTHIHLSIYVHTYTCLSGTIDSCIIAKKLKTALIVRFPVPEQAMPEGVDSNPLLPSTREHQQVCDPYILQLTSCTRPSLSLVLSMPSWHIPSLKHEVGGLNSVSLYTVSSSPSAQCHLLNPVPTDDVLYKLVGALWG